MAEKYEHPTNGITIDKVMSMLKRTLEIPQSMRATPFIWGPYGIGKSEMMRQLTEELCKEKTTKVLEGIEKELKIAKTDEDKEQIYRNAGMFQLKDKSWVAFDPKPIDIRLSLKDSGDVQGLPTFHIDHNGVKRTTWAIPDCFPSDPNWKGVIFFDEFNLGQMNVINACYQILAEFQLESIKFNPGILVVCAGNYTEIADNATPLPAGINSRVNHIDMIADIDSWIKWALNAGINSDIISFLKIKTNHFYDYDALVNGSRTLANPRAWVRASAFLNLPGYDIEENLVSDIGGIIGDPKALELKAFVKDSNRLQNPDEILKEGKDFKSESINGFYGCFISLISKLNGLTGKELESGMKNVGKALIKLEKRELKAFATQTIMGNNKISDYIADNDPDFLIEMSKHIAGVKK